MKKSFDTKIFNINKSMAVIIPRNTVRMMELKLKDLVTITVEKE